MSEPTAEQITLHLTVKIRNANMVLEVLSDELTGLSRHPHTFQISTKIMELAKCATRRNTLIEMWEYATNRQWTGD